MWQEIRSKFWTPAAPQGILGPLLRKGPMKELEATPGAIPVDKGVTIYKRTPEGSWMLHLAAGGRRERRSLHTRRRDLALRIARARAEELVGRRHGLALASDPSIADLMDLYRTHAKLRNRASTQRLNFDNLKRFLDFLRVRLPKPRALRVSDVEPAALEAYMAARLAKGIKPATINRDRCTLSTFFRRAARRGLIRRNPIEAVDPLPGLKKRLPTTLGPEQISRLLEEAERPVPFHGRGGKGAGNSRERLTPLGDLIRTALNSGLRLGELVHLEWADLDWEGRRLRVVNKEEHQLKDREDRVVGANPALMQLLRRRHGALHHPRWIFPSQAGGLLDRRNLLREFKAAAARAGVPWANFLILRHTALTALARSGAPMLVLREVAGHESTRTTERYYIGSLGGGDWTIPTLGE